MKNDQTFTFEKLERDSNDKSVVKFLASQFSVNQLIDREVIKLPRRSEGPQQEVFAPGAR